MKKFQAVVIMIALVMLASGRRFRRAVVAGTGRAIGGGTGGTPFRGWPYYVIVSPSYPYFFMMDRFIHTPCHPKRIRISPSNSGSQPTVFLRAASVRFLEQGGHARSPRWYS